MHLKRHSGLAGAQELTGCVVILDVIRCSNTVLGALESGADEVWLVGDLDQAQALKAAHPDWDLWGERGGVMVPGFQGDNSPAQARKCRLAGRSVVLTTSNGSQAAARLHQAGPVFIGSLDNAAALVRVINRLAPAEVTMLAVGDGDNRLSVEDELVAEHLLALLAGRASDPAQVAEAIRAGESGRRLCALGQHDDLTLCCRPDMSQAVPVVEAGDPPRARLWGPQDFSK